MKLFKQTYNLNYFIFIITLSTLLFSNQEDENLLNLAKEKLKNVFTTLQYKSNLAPIKLDGISEGILVVPDYESGFMQPMPNLNTSINVEIEGMIASTTVNQMYTNDTEF